MALTACSECGGKVSTEAAACPHCGASARLPYVAMPPAPTPPQPSAVPHGGSLAARGNTSQRSVTRLHLWMLLAAGGLLLLVVASVGVYFLVHLPGSAAPASDDPCAQKEGCKEYGTCVTAVDESGRPILNEYGTKTCQASSKSDCDKSQWCSQHGFCSFVPFTDVKQYGKCRVVTSADCASSGDCKLLGYCTPKFGQACVDGEVSRPVLELAIGGVGLGQPVTCCAK